MIRSFGKERVVTQNDRTLSPGATLRALIARSEGALAVPGGGTALEARCAADAGFETFYVSGYAVAAWRHGVPDVGLIAMAEIVDAVTSITAISPVPVLVDADTGYGDVANVVRTVRSLESAGAAAVQIEDQAWPKRCGHMEGKTVIPAGDMARKVRAAVRGRQDPSTVIIARTDARGPHGLKEAIDRSNRYLDAGADLIFVDAPESVDELAEISASVPGILVANMSESGKTPILPLDQLDSLGFKVVLYPTSALRLSAGVMSRLFTELRSAGATAPWVDQMMTLDNLNSLLGLEQLAELERAAES